MTIPFLDSKSGPVYSLEMPAVLRWLGGRWRDGKRSCRMTWGELNWGRWKLACDLCLFSEERFSLHLAVPGIDVFVSLPFLGRFAYEPHEMMESWGFTSSDGDVHFHWGQHTRIVRFPWSDWKHISHEVRRADGEWVPYVASYETRPEVAPGESIVVGDVNFQGKPWKEPDERQLEVYPYLYVLKSGVTQVRTATIYVERRRWRLRVFDALGISMFDRVRHSIDVQFSDEVGEESGSWKGGTVGCGYDLRPDETPYRCLKRMEEERRF